MSTLLKMQKFHPLCSRCIGMYLLQNRWTVLRYLQCYENFSECCTHLILPETALFSPTPTFAKEPFFRTFHYAYSIAVWSLSGLAMSACFLNAYLAVCAPLVFSYVLEMITIESKFLPNLWYLSLSYTDVSSNPWLASAYIILVFSCLGIVFAFVFWQIAKRRVQDVIH